MASGSDNPSYLVVHPNERYLYAVNEVEISMMRVVVLYLPMLLTP